VFAALDPLFMFFFMRSESYLVTTLTAEFVFGRLELWRRLKSNLLRVFGGQDVNVPYVSICWLRGGHERMCGNEVEVVYIRDLTKPSSVAGYET
jgi:hypothetical protein